MVQRSTPLLADAAHLWRHRVCGRWWEDETYVKVAGRWRYVYRAINQFGQAIDMYVSTRRDGGEARVSSPARSATTKVIPIEESFQTAKNEAGLDHYQVRGYRAWYSHITLAMLAAAYLAATRAQETQKGDPHAVMTC